MKKLIAFTSLASLRRIDKEKPHTANIPMVDTHRAIVYDEKLRSFKPANSLEEGELFLVYDEIGPEDFNVFTGECNKSSICVLKHQAPDNIELSHFGMVKKGVHERDGKYYPLLLGIIADDKENKFQRLHQFMVKNDPLERAISQLIMDVQDGNFPEILEGELKPFRNDVKAFQSTIKGKDWLDENYMIAFQKFIDALHRQRIDE